MTGLLMLFHLLAFLFGADLRIQKKEGLVFNSLQFPWE